MESSIALFAYDFPHRKTHDFILDLRAIGVRRLVVLAAPKKQLKSVDRKSYFRKSLRSCPALDTQVLCTNLDIPYYRIAHGDTDQVRKIQLEHDAQLAIISGARILRKEVIDLFGQGIVNFHPGKLPQTSGLDAFYYTIKNGVEAGVTTHFIDHRVDAGEQIFFDEVKLNGAETPEILLENVYQMQRVALKRFISHIRDGLVDTTNICRPHKNSPMSPDEKVDLLKQFLKWRDARVVDQNTRSSSDS